MSTIVLLGKTDKQLTLPTEITPTSSYLTSHFLLVGVPIQRAKEIGRTQNFVRLLLPLQSYPLP